jgi:hypothetical protein
VVPGRVGLRIMSSPHLNLLARPGLLARSSGRQSAVSGQESAVRGQQSGVVPWNRGHEDWPLGARAPRDVSAGA